MKHHGKTPIDPNAAPIQASPAPVRDRKGSQRKLAAEAQGSGGAAGSAPGKGQGGLSGSYPNQGAKRGVQPGAARNRG